MGTGGSFPRGKARPVRDADYSPHLVSRLSVSMRYTPLPPCASMACSATALLFKLWLNGVESFLWSYTRRSGNSSSSVEPSGSLPCSQESNTGSYHEPVNQPLNPWKCCPTFYIFLTCMVVRPLSGLVLYLGNLSSLGICFSYVFVLCCAES
jgi:hypothetical protein